MSALLPMLPTLYAQRIREVELLAEHDAVQTLIDNGHEFAALMEVGGSVRCSGQWQKITSFASVSDRRVLIVLPDGTEWLAPHTATRAYRGVEG